MVPFLWFRNFLGSNVADEHGIFQEFFENSDRKSRWIQLNSQQCLSKKIYIDKYVVRRHFSDQNYADNHGILQEFLSEKQMNSANVSVYEENLHFKSETSLQEFWPKLRSEKQVNSKKKTGILLGAGATLNRWIHKRTLA
jgi:hypothetical protein